MKKIIQKFIHKLKSLNPILRYASVLLIFLILVSVAAYAATKLKPTTIKAINTVSATSSSTKPTSSQNIPTTQSTHSTNSPSSSTPSAISYCPLSDGQLTPNKSTYSCAVLDQGECGAYEESIQGALFNSINSMESTINEEVNNAWSLSKDGVSLSYIEQTINEYYTQGNNDLYGLYETYVQNFKPPYPNCNPPTEAQVYTPYTLLNVASATGSTTN